MSTVLDTSRIEALRRRVQQDPASIAFAQLADELRREGQFADAVAVCRSGLLRHPGYVSARVTLGRALVEMGDLDAAQVELEEALHLASQNLAAVRALADLHARRRAEQRQVRAVATATAAAENAESAAVAAAQDLTVTPGAIRTGQAAPALEETAPHGEFGVDTPDTAWAIDHLAETWQPKGTEPTAVTEPGADPPVAASEWEDMSTIAAGVTTSANPERDDDVYVLERWLAAILDARERRHSGR